MAKSVKKVLKEEYNRLKKAFEKIVKPGKERPMPSWVLQPVQNKKNPRNF